uniref:cation:proton antiporter domain-containing protein n=1 Tax=Zoogloea ramigera TaxID=350 RepID=UPI003FA22F27
MASGVIANCTRRPAGAAPRVSGAGWRGVTCPAGAAGSPILAQLIPVRFIPQPVLLPAAGAALGLIGLGIIEVNDAVKLLNELGMAFLFLLAGYEIDPKRLAGHQGKVGLLIWGITLGPAWL